MRMSDKKANDSLCEDALTTCRAICANLTVLQNQLVLGLPVDETARIIDRDMQIFNDQLEAIGDVIMEDDEDGCEESC